MSLLSIKQAAAELSVSQQWLKYWLVANPVDTAGVPFYVPIGRRWKFEPRDIERILAHLRALESARLGPSEKSKVRLVRLMSQIGGGGYEGLLRRREEEKRKKEAEKANRPPRQPRGRLPRAKKPEPPAD
jgi:hypothetical protein